MNNVNVMRSEHSDMLTQKDLRQQGTLHRLCQHQLVIHLIIIKQYIEYLCYSEKMYESWYKEYIPFITIIYACETIHYVMISLYIFMEQTKHY